MNASEFELFAQMQIRCSSSNMRLYAIVRLYQPLPVYI